MQSKALSSSGHDEKMNSAGEPVWHSRECTSVSAGCGVEYWLCTLQTHDLEHVIQQRFISSASQHFSLSEIVLFLLCLWPLSQAGELRSGGVDSILFTNGSQDKKECLLPKVFVE